MSSCTWWRSARKMGLTCAVPVNHRPIATSRVAMKSSRWATAPGGSGDAACSPRSAPTGSPRSRFGTAVPTARRRCRRASNRIRSRGEAEIVGALAQVRHDASHAGGYLVKPAPEVIRKQVPHIRRASPPVDHGVAEERLPVPPDPHETGWGAPPGNPLAVGAHGATVPRRHTPGNGLRLLAHVLTRGCPPAGYARQPCQPDLSPPSPPSRSTRWPHPQPPPSPTLAPPPPPQPSNHCSSPQPPCISAQTPASLTPPRKPSHQPRRPRQ